MYLVDEKPETIHLYVVREQAPRPPVLPIILSVLALCILAAFCILTPYQQPVTRTTIRVPAVPLGIKNFSASVAVIPTGIKTYPATTAHGVLTITNGSIIGQSIPAGFTVQGVATDRAVYVSAGDANGYGVATVSAHALIPGKGGNFATLAINQVIGSSVYIRNLSPFIGGKDSYSVRYVTVLDQQTALIKARNQLALPVYHLSGAVIYARFKRAFSWKESCSRSRIHPAPQAGVGEITTVTDAHTQLGTQSHDKQFSYCTLRLKSKHKQKGLPT